jgi:hypothetical protein
VLRFAAVLRCPALADVPFADSDANTDFDRETVREIQAADRVYRLRFGWDKTVAVEIETGRSTD